MKPLLTLAALAATAAAAALTAYAISKAYPRLPAPAPAAVDLTAMSTGALVAVMNALNTSPYPFACAADREAFSAASVQVARRHTARRAAAAR